MSRTLTSRCHPSLQVVDATVCRINQLSIGVGRVLLPGIDTTIWPQPESLGTVADFVAALRIIREMVGVSYQTLAQRSAVLGRPTSRQTIHNICNRDTLPTHKQLEMYLLSCGADNGLISRWLHRRQALARHPELAETHLVEMRALPGAEARPALAAAEEPAGAACPDLPRWSLSAWTLALLLALVLLLGLAGGFGVGWLLGL
ncbi:hypothetical protein M8C13_08745 [Crossiella sp. SN42]|uniref:hypothetical protein n=1 Tax=Crossiella sp. SN42 TaxID=2944808 RepID=UPI00207D67AD|nr:hypothetical protein [Crossiella sp. SN42]MCO1575843.1 hypothetical protein [Crossiella sp. SN42]